jgi:hypothetical protein
MRRQDRALGWRFAGCVVLMLAAASVDVPRADAFPWWARGYTADGTCVDENYTDPVNLVFDGPHGTAANTIRGMENHNNWFLGSGSSQNLSVALSTSAYRCDEMDGQRANGTTTESRFHARVWGIPGAPGRLVAGAAHHEDFVNPFQCPPFGGHAVDQNGPEGSGFDQGRRRLVDGWQAHGHVATGKLWGNTRNFMQCDGGIAGSDGVGVVLNMHHNHPTES